MLGKNTHVFIVNDNTFKYHLEYMFAGTGADDKKVDFNGKSISKLPHGTQRNLVGMMADGMRIRKGDYIIFYLQATSEHEGKFYGVFEAIENGIFLDNNDKNQFLNKELMKSLTFRTLIKPIKGCVYACGVTEWEALDDISDIQSPQGMIWSLIYRKLKGNRGNTMITLYECSHLTDLIAKKNNRNPLIIKNNQGLTYNELTGNIEITNIKNVYTGRKEIINILPRLIDKYNKNQAYEVFLQMYITQNIGLGTNKSLDKAFDTKIKQIEWIGNEVSCGVGMQRIDILLSTKTANETIVSPIELKAVGASLNNIRQIKRYMDWFKLYYYPNIPSALQPVLLCKKCVPLTDDIKKAFIDLKNEYKSFPLIYIEHYVNNNDIFFERIDY